MVTTPGERREIVILRTLVPEDVSRRRPPRHCKEPGCGQATREGKPYCSDHVDRHAYVQEVLRTLRERDEVDAEVARRGYRAVDPSSLTAQEMLVYIEVHGAKTVKRLARELNGDLAILRHYAEGLRRAGLVRLTPTRRRSTLVHPIPGALAKSQRSSNGGNDKQAA